MGELAIVMIGGAVGSGLRFLVAAALPVHHDTFPWPTFLVNVLGSFALGLLSGIALKSDILSRTTLLLLGTGVCGGFTTFSTFSMESVGMLQAGHAALALFYMAGSLVGGLGAAALGVGVVRVSWT